jgi:hypothetical protein
MFAMVKDQAPLNVREQIHEIMGDNNGVLDELK